MTDSPSSKTDIIERLQRAAEFIGRRDPADLGTLLLDASGELARLRHEIRVLELNGLEKEKRIAELRAFEVSPTIGYPRDGGVCEHKNGTWMIGNTRACNDCNQEVRTDEPKARPDFGNGTWESLRKAVLRLQQSRDFGDAATVQEVLDYLERAAQPPSGALLCDAVEEHVIKAFLAAGRRATDSELSSIASRIRASETKPEIYVCPQCGPDPRGEEEHARAAHTIAGLMGTDEKRECQHTRCVSDGTITQCADCGAAVETRARIHKCIGCDEQWVEGERPQHAFGCGAAHEIGANRLKCMACNFQNDHTAQYNRCINCGEPLSEGASNVDG